MDSFDRLDSVFKARVDEVIANLRVRQTHSFFVRHQAELFAFRSIPAYLKRDFTGAINIKGAPEAVAYRGFILQLYGAFEKLITETANAALDAIQVKARRYSDLPEALRNAHTVGSARLLSRVRTH